MKAVAVSPQERSVALLDIDRPRLARPGDVLLRVLDVGICGTDREICHFDYGTPPGGSPHLVLGHEALAQVVETGAAVTGLATGDLVVPMVRRPCEVADCAPCRARRQDFCTTGRFTERGIKEAHGFMTELIVEDAQYLVPLDPALREIGVLVEPLTIAEKALAQVWQIQRRLPWGRGGAQPGHGLNAVVLGAGPVGLLGAMKLRAAGFTTYVYARTPAPNVRAALAERIGARYVSSETVAPRDLPQLAGNVDLVYEAVGASQVAFEVLQHLGTNGVFVFTGVPGRKGPVSIDTDAIMRNLVLRNQVVLGSVNAGRDAFEEAARDLVRFEELWPGALAQMITGRFPAEAHGELLLGRAEGIKNVVRLG